MCSISAMVKRGYPEGDLIEGATLVCGASLVEFLSNDETGISYEAVIASAKRRGFMAKELLIRALRGERVTQIPWLPHIGTHPAQLLGVSAERYLQEAELLAQGAVLCAERYHCDGIALLDDPQMEAIALGCTPHWSEQSPPSIISSPLSRLSPEQLIQHLPPLPDETTGRWPTVIEAGAQVKPVLEQRD